MSRTESLVMELLRGRERYGLELVDASDGTLKRGSVYVILARMEEKGFVDSRQEDRAGRHQRVAAPPLSRDAVRAQGARRVRDAARGVGPQADGGANELRLAGHRVLRSLPVAAHLRPDRRAGAGRSRVRGGRRAVAAGSPTAPRCCGRSPAAWRHDIVRGSGGFLRLTLLSACYYMFPVAVSVRIFKTWSDFFIAAS